MDVREQLRIQRENWKRERQLELDKESAKITNKKEIIPDNSKVFFLFVKNKDIRSISNKNYRTNRRRSKEKIYRWRTCEARKNKSS